MTPPKGSSPILRGVVAAAFVVTNIFALHLLLRGHNEPGGGFIAGLAFAISLVLLMLAFGLNRTQQALRVEPVHLASIGLLLAILSALAPVVVGRAFLEQFNTYVQLPLLGRVPLGTPLIFDTGVFLLVVGISTKLIFTLARSTEGHDPFPAEEEDRFAAPMERSVEADAAQAEVEEQEPTPDSLR